MSQNTALEAQLLSQQNIAQDLAEFPGAITTVLSRSQVPTRRRRPVNVRKQRRKFLRVDQEDRELRVWCDPERVLASAVEWQEVVTSATVSIGVPEFRVETSAETDVQLFVVLSALTESESFDIVMSAGGGHGIESWRKLHGRWNPYTAGRARSLLREILSPTRAKLPELVCAIGRWKIS